MEQDLYKRAKESFLRICDLPEEDRRAALDEECADDPELRAEVEALLKHHDTSSADTAELPEEGTPAPAEEPRVRSVGPYRVIREIGRGGMGVVYLGVREGDQFKRRVAIKVLKRGTDTERVLHRFDLERQVLSALNHAGIARLFDAGETEDGVPYFAMEYVEGIPIDQYCDIHRLHIDERLELFRRVCSAVHYAHQNLIVHRDLKPGNIVVTKEGQPKLLDFGIAKLINPELSMFTGDPTAPEFRVMTPEYASPEQVRGDPITTASDVYSLGVLLYEVLSGHRPYRLRSRVRAELERVICDEDPEKPSTAISRVEAMDSGDPATTKTVTPESVSKAREGKIDRLRRRLAGDLDNIVLMAMRKEPLRRYNSAESLADDLHRHLSGLPVTARRDTMAYRTAKFIRRNRGGVAAAAIIVIILVAGSITTTLGWWAAAEAEQDALIAQQEAVTQRDEADEQRRIADEQRMIADDNRQEAEKHRLIAEDERQRAKSYRAQAKDWFNRYTAFAREITYSLGDAFADHGDSGRAKELLMSAAVQQLEVLAEAAEVDLDLRRELASGYVQVGDIQGSIGADSRGDLEDALVSYRAALKIQRELVSELVEGSGVRRELSATHLRIGDMLRRMGDPHGALEVYQASLAIRQELADADPSDFTARRDLAIALSSVGAAHAALGEDEAALKLYERSRVLREQLDSERDDDLQLKRDRSSICLRVGGRLEAVGDYDAALRQYEQALAIREQLVQEKPESGSFRRDLAVAHYFVGKVHLRLDDRERALPHLEQYFTIMQQRMWDNEGSARAKREFAAAYEIIAGTKGLMGDWEAALEDYRTLQSMMRPLVDEHPEDTLNQLLLAVSYEGIAESMAELEDVSGAIEQARKAVAMYEQLINEDPDTIRWRERLPAALANLGIWLAEDGHPGEAIEQLQVARQRYDDLSDDEALDASGRSGLITTLHELSKLMVKLGDGEAALRLAERALTMTDEPTAELLRDLAVALHLTGDDGRAIEAATEALSLLEGEEGEDVAELRTILEEDLKTYRQQ